MKRLIGPGQIFIAFLSCCSVFSQGTIVYSSFSATGDYNHNAAGYSGPGIPEIGFQFRVSQGGQLGQVEIPLFGNPDSAGSLLLCRTDLVTGLPGTALETFFVGNLPSNLTLFRTQTYTSTLRPELSLTDSYFLVLRSAPDSVIEWNVSLDEQAPFYSIQNGVPNVDPNLGAGRSGAFSITVVPEPLPLAMFCFASFAVVGWFRLSKA